MTRERAAIPIAPNSIGGVLTISRKNYTGVHLLNEIFQFPISRLSRRVDRDREPIGQEICSICRFSRGDSWLAIQRI